MVIRAFYLASTFVTVDTDAARTPQRFIPPAVMGQFTRSLKQVLDKILRLTVFRFERISGCERTGLFGRSWFGQLESVSRLDRFEQLDRISGFNRAKLFEKFLKLVFRSVRFDRFSNSLRDNFD